MEGRTFGDVPLNAELKLEVWDSPNSAGVVIDAVRLIKLALNHGLSGTLEGPSAYLMKSPPVQHSDSLAHEMTERFISEYGIDHTDNIEESKPDPEQRRECVNGHKAKA
jgi:myo-inositol-1-phosphate synthase